jgi:hypothetical protein
MIRRRLIRAAIVVAAVALLVIGVVYLRGIPGHTRPHQTVGAQAQTLREAFNVDTGTVRIVALVSPTCGACLRGAAEMQTVFGEIGDPRLRGYIVWVPKLDGHEDNVSEATHTVADPRAGHYGTATAISCRPTTAPSTWARTPGTFTSCTVPEPGGTVPTRLHPTTG